MSILAIYDVLKIQEFIFASNKLSENLGASIFVQDVFETFLVSAIEATVTEKELRCTDWKTATTFAMGQPKATIQAEVIYIGGGNAMVAYADETIALNVTQALSATLLKKTGGMLQFAVAYHKTSFANYQNDKTALFKQLILNKAERIHTSPLSGIGITRADNGDGLPTMIGKAGSHGRREFFSQATTLKQQTEEAQQRYFDKLLPPTTTDFVFPRELDALGQEKGDENYIAIVHIDGNNQGAMFEHLATQARDYNDAVQRIRTASRSIAETYARVMKTLVASMVEWCKESGFAAMNFNKNRQYQLPLRPIVLNGDDVTFVCYGKFGVPLAELFLKELDEAGKQANLPLSACAGVAIVKSHFPFYRAYTLAEELCDSAKSKAKILAKVHGHADQIGSWLDFHIVQSGVTSDLSELRKRFYNIPSVKSDWTPPPQLQYPEAAEQPDMKYDQYHLLWRPWQIVGQCEQCQALYAWQELLRIRTALNPNIGETTWKQSRLKRLRNTMITSLEDISDTRKEFASRNIRVPEFLTDDDNKKDRMVFKKDPHKRDSNNKKVSLRQTPYFDALELLDYYEQIPTVKGGETL